MDKIVKLRIHPLTLNSCIQNLSDVIPCI